MSRVIATAATAALVLAIGAPAGAQTKVLQGERRTVSAVVEAVEQSTRTVVLRMKNGELKTLQAPADAARFSEIKVGDTVNATVYDNIVIRKKQPGEPDVDTLNAALTAGSGAKAGGTAAVQQTITATITAIDPNVPSISLKGPRGWSYSSKVQDKKALAQVKVGDKVDITWTDATLVSLAPDKK
jgi:hypothetical protein